MPIIVWITIITFISGVIGTGTGGLIGGIAKNVSNRAVAMLLCFASGVMLAIVCLDLLAEAIAPSGIPTIEFLIYTILGTVTGYLIVYYLNKYVDSKQKEKHQDVKKNRESLFHVHLFSAGIILAIAIALHNFPEGLIIGVSYTGSQSVMDAKGLAIAIVIGLHNIPEGMAVTVPLISSGMKVWKAVIIAGLSGLPTVIGAVVGYSIGSLGVVAQSLSLSFAAGAMLYVVFGELFPEAIELYRSRFLSFYTLIGIILGIIVIYLQ